MNEAVKNMILALRSGMAQRGSGIVGTPPAGNKNPDANLPAAIANDLRPTAPTGIPAPRRK